MYNLTEEEYKAIAEKWTLDPPKPGLNGTGFFAQRKAVLSGQYGCYVTDGSITTEYLLKKAKDDHKSSEGN